MADGFADFLGDVLVQDLGVTIAYLIVKPNEDTIGRFNKLKGRTYSLFQYPTWHKHGSHRTGFSQNEQLYRDETGDGFKDLYSEERSLKKSLKLK